MPRQRRIRRQQLGRASQQDSARSLLLQQCGIADKLDRIAQSLFRMQQNAPALQR